MAKGEWFELHGLLGLVALDNGRTKDPGTEHGFQISSCCFHWLTALVSPPPSSSADARAAEVAARPQTAPSGGRSAALTEARRYYHAESVRNQDVLQYRHSGGICPAEYKVGGTQDGSGNRMAVGTGWQWLLAGKELWEDRPPG